MPKMTRKQIAVYYYTVILGYSHEKSTTKYEVLLKDGMLIYIGKNGAIRKGKNLTESISLTDRIDYDKMRMYFENDKDYPERGICNKENCIVRIYCKCENHIE
jgi:hypothetical protein